MIHPEKSVLNVLRKYIILTEKTEEIHEEVNKEILFNPSMHIWNKELEI
jgi:hypothetical protein